MALNEKSEQNYKNQKNNFVNFKTQNFIIKKIQNYLSFECGLSFCGY